jgi:hypothetical protein
MGWWELLKDIQKSFHFYFILFSSSSPSFLLKIKHRPRQNSLGISPHILNGRFCSHFKNKKGSLTIKKTNNTISLTYY